jgi:hypothetical protein
MVSLSYLLPASAAIRKMYSAISGFRVTCGDTASTVQRAGMDIWHTRRIWILELMIKSANIAKVRC